MTNNKTDDQKILDAWEVIHYALVNALRQIDRPTLTFLADKADHNDAVTDAAYHVLQEMEEKQNA